MASSTCPHCGATVAPGAGFCTYCGTAISSTAAPLPSNAPPPPPPAPGPWGPVGRPGPPRRRRGLVIAVVVVVIILVASIALVEIFAPAPPPVQIGIIYIWSPDDVCGLNNNETAYYGYNTTTNSNDTLDFGIPNDNATACTIIGVTTNTTGFAITYAQVPLTIPGEDQDASMNLTIQSPGSNYNGDLNLIFR